MRNVLIALIVLVGIAFLILLAKPLMGGLESFRTQSQTDNFSIATSNVQTSINITLTHPLFQADTHYATVSSNVNTDVPLASNYTASTNKLTVSGLTANITRLLTVSYSIGALDSNVDAAVRQMPSIWFYGIVALIFLSIAIVVIAMRRR